jgi:hypothetical protein
MLAAGMEQCRPVPVLVDEQNRITRSSLTAVAS